MIFPKPFAVDILDSGALGRSLVQSATLANVLDAMDAFTTGCQLADAGTNVSVTATAADVPAIKLLNSANSGLGGQLFTIESTIAGTTGSFPFIVSAIEFDVNDDGTRDFCVLMGHNFQANSTLATGSLYGASGIKFEQHFKPSSGTNQSETYFIHLSRAGQEYRGFSLTHVNHHVADGTDTLLAGISADTISFQSAAFVDRANWTDSGLALAAGQAFSLAGLIAQWNGTTGAISTTAKNNIYNATLATSDDLCMTFTPVINANSQVVYATYVNPSYTSLTAGNFYGHRGTLLSNRACAANGFTECNVGVSGSVTVSAAWGHRARLFVATGTVTTGSCFLAETPFVTGTLTNGAGFRAEDHTGHYSIITGTGKVSLGTASANSLFAVFGNTPVVRQTVTGSRGGNAALASLITAMATFGFVTDSSS